MNYTEKNNNFADSFITDAFRLDSSIIYNGTPFENLIDEISYYHSMSIFLNDNLTTEEERRKLLYHYSKGFFSITDESSIINRLKKQLPVSNLHIKQVLQNICQLYLLTPIREIEGKNVDQFVEYLKNSNIDSAMKQIDQASTFIGKSLIRPFVLDNKIQFEILTPDRYQINEEVIDGETKQEVWVQKNIMLDNGDIISSFNIYTDETISTFYDGKIRNVEENKLGFIPYIELNYTINALNPPDTMFSLMMAELDYNRLTMVADNNVFMNGFASLILTDFGIASKNEVPTLGSGSVYVSYTAVGQNKPEVSYINPPTQFIDIDSYKEDNMMDSLRRMNLPESIVSGDKTSIASGVALKIERMGLLEFRIQHEKLLKNFDKRLVQLIANVLNAEIGTNFDDNYSIDIEYQELDYIDGETEEFNILTEKFEKGLISLATYINKTTDADNINSFDEAIEYVKNNLKEKEEFQKLFSTLEEEVIEEEVEINSIEE